MRSKLQVHFLYRPALCLFKGIIQLSHSIWLYVIQCDMYANQHQVILHIYYTYLFYLAVQAGNQLQVCFAFTNIKVLINYALIRTTVKDITLIILLESFSCRSTFIVEYKHLQPMKIKWHIVCLACLCIKCGITVIDFIDLYMLLNNCN